MKIPAIAAERLDEAVSREAASLFSDSGVLLLRLDDVTLETFEDFSRSLCDEFHEVGTRAKLRRADGDGYTTEVFRANFVLLSHSEGMYRPYPPPPDLCFFLCRTPPSAEGGETIVVDGAELLQALPTVLAERFEREGVIYLGVWARERWQAEFGVETQVDAEELLRDIADFSSSWIGGEPDLKWRYQARAINPDPSGRLGFTNGILAHLPAIDHPRYRGLPVYVNARNGVCYGNGEPLGPQDINLLIDAHDAVAHPHRWQKNDILVLDNRRFMHGRLMTRTPCERVLVSRFGRAP
jgi:alpha-ketoglutarate-dependent taurine dioxygenase